MNENQPRRKRQSIFKFDEEPLNLPESKFVDHHSIQALSDTVKFRDTTIHVYEQNDRQLLLEERFPAEDENEGDHEVMVKLVDNDNAGMVFLRASYTLVALVASGFLLIFFCNIICVTFLSISVHSNSTSIDDYEPHIVIGTLLSIPIFVSGMSAAMANAGNFTIDTWHGHTFLRMVAYWSGVTTEWVTFFSMLGIPLLTMVVTLFVGYDDWWVKTGLVWFMSVLIFYLAFSVILIYYEVKACFDLLRFDPYNERKHILGLMKETVHLHFVQIYSGKNEISYFKDETTDPNVKISVLENTTSSQTQVQKKMDLYSKFTMLSCCKRFFDHLETPTPIYDIKEMKGTKYFLTKNSWSLTKSFFKYKNSNSIVVVKGPAAVTRSQLRSSFACSLLGLFLILTLLISMMIWYNTSAYIVVPVTIGVALIMIPAVRASIYHLKLYNELQEREQSQSEVGLSEAIYRVTESFRVTKAKDTLCWSIFLLKNFLFFLWPTATFFITENYKVGSLFLAVTVLHTINHCFNAKVIISELGSLDKIFTQAVTRGRSISSVNVSFPQEKRSRIALITEKVTSSRSRDWWHFILVGFAMIVCMLYIMAIAWNVMDDTGTDKPLVTFLPDFYYPAQSSIPYPTCQVKNGIGIPENLNVSLADFAFISAITYYNSSQTQLGLDGWFGKNIATDRPDIVDKFEENYPKSAVVYKFMNFTVDDFRAGVVSVRGTSNAWDALADIQLWSAAALSKGLRALIPLGGVWTPIIPSLIKGSSVFGKEVMNKIAFYIETTAFVNYLLDSNEFDAILITGHSLGGGIAMITGAQTGIPSFGISGVNSMLSRKTFDPPITKEQLDTYTFNIVPAHDVVPMIDDPAQNYQKIRCRADVEDNMIQCHSARRTLCELLYECGTGRAPAICECSMMYGYPEPLPKHGTNRTFKEACANEDMFKSWLDK